MQIGNARSRPGITSDSSSASRARIQFSLPITVLISPLWATSRYGWASGHDGNVFVEKRECTRARADSTRSSLRSSEELTDLVRDQHPLVDEGAGREAREVHGVAPGLHLVLDALAGDEAATVEVDARQRRLALGGGQEEVAERRLHVGGLLADHGVVDGDVAPAEDAQALVVGDLGHGVHGGGLGLGVPGQERHADGVRAGLGEREVDDGPEEPVGHLDQDPGAVAHVRLGVGGAPVVEVAQGAQAQLHHAVGLAAVHVDDERDAAGVVLEARVVETLGGNPGQGDVGIVGVSFPWSGGSLGWSRALRWDVVGPRRSSNRTGSVQMWASRIPPSGPILRAVDTLVGPGY